MWSFGIILYEMAFGQIPFENFDLESFKRTIINDKIKVPELKGSPLLKDLIENCLESYYEKRFSWEQIEKHLFLASEMAKKVKKHEK